eukprot:CAMPEP_0175076944 /NCGR_PEP_ID=MMETSP0052_2-20121109/23062_1 /TAXON_ID=51329 ORGANISM="Polytomella parva, Strain SAG 63-3" /NCGR_SAMPLE_ID=MMETSP0052_2 /ASSEMBLY_ACC=CAM_ASM_000194 /LENGTH=53 /DNA_ID=CAMNT_0016346247 /DNA_START=77 /DNA_END=236 /DNA_ORIENTATION=+
MTLGKAKRNRPVDTCHTTTVPDPSPLMASLKFGLYSTEITEAECATLTVAAVA